MRGLGRGRLRFVAAMAAMAVLAGMQAGAQAPAQPANGQAGAQGAARRRGFGPPIGVAVAAMPFVHDPSTVVRFHGKYYVYSTGRGIPFYSSPDGVTWTREGSVFEQIPADVHAEVPKNNGMDVWAPDIIRVGRQFDLYYAVSSWGSFNSAVALATNPVLDPKDPAYKWTDRGVVVSSNGKEDLNAIDPGVIRAPDGTLWICYGSYHGSIRLTQLDPKTGLAVKPKELGEAIATARESEASDIIYESGYYYLFVNHGSCCKGKNSEYNIRVGRSRTITGPYVDRHGELLTKGGGSLFLAAHDHRIGPGHFGRVVNYDLTPAELGPDGEDDGAQRFSVHYEADMTREGRSVLGIRPLLWSCDGWPVAGDNLTAGTYQLVSEESENTLEEHVGGAAKPVAAGGAVEAAGAPALRLARYLTLDSQKWTIAPVAGGFYKITNAGTGDAIGVSDGAAELAVYTGTDGQMWHLDEFPDGSYRIRNKASGLALTMGERGSVKTEKFVRDDAHLWGITTP